MKTMLIALAATQLLSTAAQADELDIERLTGTALKGRDKCTTVLRMSKTRGSKPIKTLVLVAGDVGRYSMEVDDELSPPPVWLLLRHKVAVAAINKPGVSIGGSQMQVKVNDNVFKDYTIGKLVNCWADFLQQLNRQPPAGLKINRIVALGSGEGAHTLIRLYDQLIKNRSPIAQRIKTLYLTGFSVKGAYDIDMPYALGKERWAKLEKLLADKSVGHKDKARQVYELTGRSRGLPWLNDLKQHQDLRQVFSRIKDAGSKIYFNIYLGLDDSLHDIAGNRSWEQQMLAKGELNGFVRYYSGGAGLNTAASNDIYTAIAWDITAK